METTSVSASEQEVGHIVYYEAEDRRALQIQECIRAIDMWRRDVAIARKNLNTGLEKSSGEDFFNEYKIRYVLDQTNKLCIMFSKTIVGRRLSLLATQTKEGD
jgi:hypothetical protein